ncbi:EAL domain-containing protein [Idiomarina seosinensis]|uniref:EAL domain-containing protein n=1 Tax=Idiomarina seosinensis TaxID=281739 RepID=UPI00384FCF78
MLLLLLCCFVALMLAALPAALASEAFNTPNGKLRFGGDSAYPPFEWLNKGEPTGFNVELAKQISKSGGILAEYRLGPWKEIEQALRRDEIDIAPMLITEQRKDSFQFTTPFFIINHAVFGPDEQPLVGGIKSFSGMKIAVEEDSFAHNQLIKEKIDVELIIVASAIEALETVTTGAAGFALLNESTGEHLIYTYELPLKRRSTPFWAREYAFAVKKGDEKLYLWLQNSLNAVLRSGAYEKVYEKWKPDIHSADYYTIRVPFYIGYTAITALLLMTAFLLWSWLLQRRLKTRTADLHGALLQAKKAENEVKLIADYETETGLSRPHHFCQQIDKGLENRPENCELLIFKLVYLSEIQGTLGQQYSKELIDFITSLLKLQVTGPSCYYGRGIFAAFSDRSEIKEIFNQLATHQAKELPYSKYVAGYARFPEHGTDSEALLSNADSALSAALSTGQNWVLYDPSMAPDPRHKEIITAFRTDNLEGMHAVFQPQIDIKTGRIVGAEALVRWQHPILGFLSPDDFIPLVETLGFVSQVTELMIDTAIRVGAELRAQNRPIVLSVNVSVHDLVGPNFVKLVENIATRCQADLCDLKLELTETSFSNESTQINSVLEKLKELGVKISIDDFGTGYSSLAYLSIYPIQELKIDRSFVSNMVNNTKNCNIIQSTVVLANHLQLNTVAEGIEDAPTLALLSELGCDCAQGYFISKPLAEAEFFEYLDRETR